MKNKKTEANLSMIVSKTFSGLNANALKYLLPLWIAPLTGVMFRCVFAAIVFWIISIFWKQDKTTRREKITLFLGAIGLYGFMFFYLLGVSKTTPVSSSLFSSLQPIWVFILSVIFLRERITAMKIIGIAIGLGGALLCILTQKSDDLASDAFTGNMLCLISSIAYAAYLIVSNVVLGKVSSLNMLRYSFLGAAVSSLIVMAFTGFDGHLFIPGPDVCPYLSHHNQLSTHSDRPEISEYYAGCPLRLHYINCCHHRLPFHRAGPFQLVSDDCHRTDLFERLFR